MIAKRKSNTKTTIQTVMFKKTDAPQSVYTCGLKPVVPRGKKRFKRHFKKIISICNKLAQYFYLKCGGKV